MDERLASAEAMLALATPTLRCEKGLYAFQRSLGAGLRRAITRLAVGFIGLAVPDAKVVIFAPVADPCGECPACLERATQLAELTKGSSPTPAKHEIGGYI